MPVQYFVLDRHNAEHMLQTQSSGAKGRVGQGARGLPGAAQSKVPAAEARVAELLMILASPTSAILATPPRPSRMLWLFKSR